MLPRGAIAAMSQPTVVASWTHAVLDFAGAEGQDVAALCEKAGLSSEILEDKEHRVPYARHLALWQALQERVDDPAFGLRMGLTAASAQSLDALGYLMRSSATMGEVFRQLERFRPLVNEAAIQKVLVEEEHAVLVDGPLHGAPWPPLYSDQVAATYYGLASTWSGVDLRGTRIELPHGEPDCESSPHRDLLGDGVEFGATRLAVHMPRGFRERPLVTAEPHLAAHLEQHARHLLSSLPEDPFLGRVVESLNGLLSEGAPPRVDFVAKDLALSRRSLQRRLREHDTTFQELVDGVRHRTALRVLSETDLSLDDCAERLGFRNVSAFRRAFVRWVGAPPGRVRREGVDLAQSG